MPASESHRTLVFAAGPDVAGLVPGERFDLVVAADGGLDRADALGITVDVVVGDLDSATPDLLAAHEAGGGRIERHPPAKDAGDLQLALDHALAAGTDEIVVVGWAGGRLDHHAVNLAVAASPRYRTATVELRSGTDRAWPLHGPAERAVPVVEGDTISLLALGGDAVGVTITGVRWPLTDHTLPPDTSLALSNVATMSAPTVSLTAGTLLVMAPGPHR